MAKKLEIINGVFTVTDTISLTREFEHIATEIKHLYSSGLIFFYYDETANPIYVEGSKEIDQLNKVRSRGYLLAELQDDAGGGFATYQDFLDWFGASAGAGATVPPNNIVEDYISSFEADLYIYAGWHLNSVPTIKRTKDSVEETAQGVTDLPTDWGNRLGLTYI